MTTHRPTITEKSKADIERANEKYSTPEGVRQREARRACEDRKLAKELSTRLEDLDI